MLPGGTLSLSGVRKTLRKLYAPTSEPNEAIVRALQALARLERIEPVAALMDAALMDSALINAARLAPAA